MRLDAREHVTELLPAYVNRGLEPAAADLVEAHFASCQECRFELLEWREVAPASRALMLDASVPSPLVLDRVRAAIDASPSMPKGVSVRPSADHLWQVLRGQTHLIQAQLWAASAVIMALGFVVAATGHLGGPSVVLQLVAPIVAAAGVSLVYGPEVDPSLELALAAPTSPRLILLARLTLVFGYDLALVLTSPRASSSTMSGSSRSLMIDAAARPGSRSFSTPWDWQTSPTAS
jgi:anti-sigma factor RsiW